MSSSCKTDCGLVGATNVRNPLDIISPVIESGIDPLMIMGPEYPLTPFLFDTQLNSIGDTVIGLKLKNINVVNAKYTNANCALEWIEKYDCRIEANIVSVAGSVITVDSIKKLRGVNTGSEILLSDPATGASETVTVVSVLGNTITVNPAPTVVAGVVSRLQYTATGSACNANANNVYTSIEEGTYQTPFRRIRLTMDFTQCDLSVQRYAYGDPAKAFLDDLVASGAVGAREEFSSVFYMDNGWTMPSTTNINTNQTNGLITGIQYAQGVANKNFIHDFSLICDTCTGTDCEKDEAVVSAFYDILMAMYDTGLYNSNPITLVANKQQYDEMRKLEKVFADYHQITLVYNPGDQFQSIYSSLNMIRLPFAYVNVDIYLDRWLDRFQTPVMLAMPAHRVFVAQRPFYSVEASDSGTIKAMNSSLSAGNPKFKFINRTEIEGDGTGECVKLKAYMDLAVLPQWIFTGAYRIFLNLKACSSTCNPLCTTAAPVLTNLVTLN